MASNLVQMPRYKCRKTVWALKIARVEGNVIYPEDEAYAPFKVSNEYLEKHSPYAGGYFVQYKDGYISFSPAEAFEEGYTLED